MTSKLIKTIKKRWSENCGYAAVLKISLPLILSTGSWSVQHFVDRMFLTWYSAEAIAASMPAGMANWTLVSLFFGTAIYVNTFVAQYFGAKNMQKIGSAIWQGIYLSAITPFCLAPFFIWAPELFALFGHQPEIEALEVVYFQMLLLGAPFAVLSNAVSGFFAGLGKTWTVMWVNIAGTLVNIVLDYFMIFGIGIFPEMGMVGAGLATDAGALVTAVIFMALMLQKKYDAEYHTRRAWRFDPALFRRLLRFGLPNGLQFVLEVLAFTVFVFLVGKLGVIMLASSNIALNISMLAFLPMFGLSMGVSILVGQHLGENRPDLAERTTWSAFHLGFFYFSVLGLAYFGFPQLFLFPFALQSDPSTFAEIAVIAEMLLRFVAFYGLFDAGNMIFSGALKGAGDTRFVAIASFGLSWLILMTPSLLAFYMFDGGIIAMWCSLTGYVMALCLVFWWRFMQGKWRDMRVIETPDPALSTEF